jgi:4-carboxymuconolactone decarboxylase
VSANQYEIRQTEIDLRAPPSILPRAAGEDTGGGLNDWNDRNVLNSFEKHMPRLPVIDTNKLSSEQRAIYDRLMRQRGHMRGPFAVWLRNAELCDSTLKLQEMFASRVKLERRLLELMILVAARLATAQYAWFIHEPYALKFGISPGIVQAIRERRTPEFSREDERLVYDLTMELNTTRTLSEASCARGMMTLNAFAVAVPAGKEPLI